MPWLLLPLAYLLGSLSPAYWAGRLNGKDLRRHGSGNLGATNAGRVLGGRWFAAVFAADLLKGVAPVLAARWLDPGHPWLGIATAAAVILGHVFTCFHGFRGGKAVAASLGAIAALAPLVAAGALAVWLAAWTLGWTTFHRSRSAAVGPASVLAACAVPPLRLALSATPWSAADWPLTAFLCALSLLVVAKHRSNIRELLRRPA